MHTQADHRELAYHLSKYLKPKASILVVGQDFQCVETAVKEHDFTAAYFYHGNGLVKSFGEQNLSERFDAILFNKAITSLSDEDIGRLLQLALLAVRPDGYLLIREDMGEKNWSSSSSGSYSAPTGGSTFLQGSPATPLHTFPYFTNIFDLYRCPPVPADSGDSPAKVVVGCDLIWAKSVCSTIASKHSWNDFCWMIRRAEYPAADVASATGSLRSFLDGNQYTGTGIDSYEWVFGDGFISPGGPDHNRKFVERVGLCPGQRVLDVGSGIGGNAVTMAQEFGVSVVAADLSSNMTAHALAKANATKNGLISFMVTDVMLVDIEPASFDVIYSRDCIIHIADKKALFQRFYRWLKPGGKVVMTDYCVGENEFTPKFKEYLKRRQYGLRPIRTYLEAFGAAGFEQVESEDLTDEFRTILKNELGSLEARKNQFLKLFDQETYDSMVASWNDKIGYNLDGDHKWAFFKAVKPMA